jgi:cytochrome P450
MQDNTSELVSKWSSSDISQRIDVLDGLRRLNLESTVLCFFGERLNCISGSEPPVIKVMDESTAESMHRANPPKLLNWLLYQRKYDNYCQILRDFAAEILARRKSNPTPNNDMLHTLLHTQDPQTGTSVTHEQVIEEILTLVIGSTTAPCLLTLTIYYLLQHPHCTATARDEIVTVIGSTSTQFTQSDLFNLPYCTAILRESLRLSAAAPGFNIGPIPSSSPAPVTLAGGQYALPPKTSIIALLASVNRDPDVFGPDPEALRPERMLGDAFEKLPKGAKMWFGNGKRKCIAEHFGWQWGMVTLVSVLRGVELRMDEGGYELRMDGAYNIKPVRFYVRAGPRRGEWRGCKAGIHDFPR